MNASYNGSAWRALVTVILGVTGVTVALMTIWLTAAPSPVAAQDVENVASVGFAYGSDHRWVYEGEPVSLRVRLAGWETATRTVRVQAEFSDGRQTQTLEIETGNWYTTLEFVAPDDDIVNATPTTLTVTLSAPVNAVLTADLMTVVLTVYDDEFTNVASVGFYTLLTPVAYEGESVTLLVTLGGVVATRTVRVQAEFSDGRHPQTLEIETGSWYTTLEFVAPDDDIGNVVPSPLRVTLSAPVNAVLTADFMTVVITVADDDALSAQSQELPTVEISAEYTLFHSDEQITVNLSIGEATDTVSILQVNLQDPQNALQNTISAERTVRIPPGETSASIVLEVRDNLSPDLIHEISIGAAGAGLLPGATLTLFVLGNGVFKDAAPVFSAETVLLYYHFPELVARDELLIHLWQEANPAEYQEVLDYIRNQNLRIVTYNRGLGGFNVLQVRIPPSASEAQLIQHLHGLSGVWFAGINRILQIPVPPKPRLRPQPQPVERLSPVASVGFLAPELITATEGETVTLRVELAPGATATRTVRVQAEFSDGRQPQTLEIEPGSRSTALEVVAPDDDIENATPTTLTVTLSAPVNAVLTADSMAVVITAADDDALSAQSQELPTVEISAKYPLFHSDEQITVNVSIGEATDTVSILQVNLQDPQNALQNTISAEQTVRIPPGETSASIVLEVRDNLSPDLIHEISIGAAGAGLLPGATFTLSVLGNGVFKGAAPVFETEMVLLYNTVPLLVARDELLIHLRRKAKPAEYQEVLDYIRSQNLRIVTYNRGLNVLQVRIPPSASETQLMQHLNGLSGVLFAGLNQIVQTADFRPSPPPPEPPRRPPTNRTPMITVFPSAAEWVEEGDSITYTVSRANVGTAVDVMVRIIGISADADPSELSMSTPIIHIPAGTASVEHVITALTDGEREDAERFRISFTPVNAGGSPLGPAQLRELTVTNRELFKLAANDDTVVENGLLVVRITRPANVELNREFVLPITVRHADSREPVTADLAFPSSMAITPGAAYAEFRVRALSDGVEEGAERFELSVADAGTIEFTVTDALLPGAGGLQLAWWQIGALAILGALTVASALITLAGRRP